MTVDDLWFLKAKKDENGERIPSKRYGRGKRYRVRYTDPDGNPKTKLYAKKGDAERADLDLRSKVLAGTYIDPSAGRQALRPYAEAWLAAQTFDETSRESTTRRVRTHILPALGNLTLGELSQRPSLIQAWQRGLQNRLAPSYVRVIFTHLSSILAAAQADGLIVRNPCQAPSVKKPAVKAKKLVPWTVDRVEAVRAGLMPLYRGTVDAGFGAGLRQGEVFGLAVDDVDWLRFGMHVRVQVRQINGRPVFAPPKGGKEREVPISEVTSHRLAAHLKEFPAKAVTLPWLVPDGKPVTRSLMFTTQTGQPIDRHHYNPKHWKPALVVAGIIPKPRPGERYEPSREQGFHQLRHGYASEALAGGLDIRTLAEYLGHNDPGFTLRVYTHLIPGGEDKVRRIMTAALAPVVPTLYRVK
jgi:integrase